MFINVDYQELVICIFHREKETAILKEQINKLTTQIKREESKATDLRIRAKYANLIKIFGRLFIYLNII